MKQPVILRNKEKWLGPAIAVSLIHRAAIPPVDNRIPCYTIIYEASYVKA